MFPAGVERKGPSAPAQQTEGPAPCSGASRPMRKASMAAPATETLRDNPDEPLAQRATDSRVISASVSLPPDLAVERDTHVTRVTASESKLPDKTPRAISYADAASCDTGLLPEGEFARASLASNTLKGVATMTHDARRSWRSGSTLHRCAEIGWPPCPRATARSVARGEPSRPSQSCSDRSRRKRGR